MKEGIVVTLFGPGGNYRGALLAFSPLGEDSAAAFPKLASGKPVRVTLAQGNIKPVTLNAIYMETGAKSPPLLAFAVPSIEALLGGMEDKWSFDVSYGGKSIANIEWHDGLRAATNSGTASRESLLTMGAIERLRLVDGVSVPGWARARDAVRNFLTISRFGSVLSFIAVCGHSSQSAIAYDAQTQTPHLCGVSFDSMVAMGGLEPPTPAL